MKSIYLLSVLCVLVIAGCSTAVTPKNASSLNLNKNGLVLSSWQHSGGPAHGMDWQVEVPLYPTGERAQTIPVIKSSNELSLLEVPPGHYRIVDCQFLPMKMNQEGARAEFEFDVRPGEVTYLGCFAVAYETGVRVNDYLELKAQFVLEDRKAMDYGRFRESYPTLALVKMGNAAPKRFEWDEERTPEFNPRGTGLETRLW